MTSFFYVNLDHLTEAVFVINLFFSFSVAEEATSQLQAQQEAAPVTGPALMVLAV